MDRDPPRGGPTIDVDLTDAPLDVAAAYAAVAHPECGGVGVFAGVVRNHHEGVAVDRLEYEAWQDRAVEAMRAVAAGVVARHVAVRAVHVRHRVGPLDVGEISVLCAASAPHRAQALVATGELIDRVKAEVPIWKKELRADGSAHWPGGG